jgi:hypothetical protein
LSGSRAGSDFLNWLGPDPDPSLYKMCTKFFQKEIFGPKVAFKSYFWEKS